MSNGSRYQVGTTIEHDGERYIVLRVVPLDDFSRLYPDRDRWGTHVLLMRRERDRRLCVANGFESGRLSPPEDWLEDYL